MVYCPVGRKYPYSHGGTEYTEMERIEGSKGIYKCPDCGHETGKKYQLSIRIFVKQTDLFATPQEAKRAGLGMGLEQKDVRVEMV